MSSSSASPQVMAQSQDVILNIEDDTVSRSLTSYLLKSAGYKVIETDNGLEGIDLARKHKPVLILMDMGIPGLDGYEATMWLKNLEETKDIPVVAITANIMAGDRERSLVAGCDGYFSKPVNPRAFVRDIESYINGYKETLTAEEQEKYLREMNVKVVRRLEEQIRELTRTNNDLEQTIKEKVNELDSTHALLLQSEKMAAIGQLAAGVAHEINNPIGYIGSNLHTLGEYAQDVFRLVNAYEKLETALPEGDKQLSEIAALKKEIAWEGLNSEVSELLEECEEGLTHVKQIVSDLKDFSRAGDNKVLWVNINNNIDSTLNIVNNEIKYKAELVKHYGELPDIKCVPEQINQVIMNLLVNAAQAIEQHGTITISTGVDEDYVWFEVADTGVGIDEENIEKLFEPFFTTKPVGQGTGLGLSVSFGIIQKHHGRIEVSANPGQGASFKVFLPIQPEE